MPASPKSPVEPTSAVSPMNSLLPPEEQFWEKYSPHHEFPISTVSTVLLHVLMLGMLILIFRYARDQDDRGSVPVKALLGDGSLMGGDGDAGAAEGASGDDTNRVEQTGEVQTPQTQAPTIPATELPRIRVAVTEWVPSLQDNQDLIDVSETIKKMANLGDAAQKLIAGTGGKKGSGSGKAGDGPGKGGEGGGPGTSTAERTVRWRLTFNTLNGRNYMEQIAALGGRVLIPQPPDFQKNFHVIDDPRRPGLGNPFNLTDNKEMFFIDDNPRSVGDVAAYLRLPFAIPYFVAVFPKEVEEELARKERAYRGHREEDILFTKFDISVRGGRYTIVVTDQQVKGQRR